MFPDMLKSLRKRNKISQGKLAEILSVTQQTVSNWEKKNGTSPDFNALKRLGKLFNVSMDYLLEYEKPTETNNKEISFEDKRFLSKLHALDARGRGSVLTVLNHEYSFVEPLNAQAVS